MQFQWTAPSGSLLATNTFGLSEPPPKALYAYYSACASWALAMRLSNITDALRGPIESTKYWWSQKKKRPAETRCFTDRLHNRWLILDVDRLQIFREQSLMAMGDRPALPVPWGYQIEIDYTLRLIPVRSKHARLHIKKHFCHIIYCGHGAEAK